MTQDQQYILLIRPRQQGKTADLVKIASQDPRGAILVPFRDMKMIMIERFNLPPHRVVTFDELGPDNVHIENLYIDDADMILQRIFQRYRIKAITMTGGVPVKEKKVKEKVVEAPVKKKPKKKIPKSN